MTTSRSHGGKDDEHRIKKCSRVCAWRRERRISLRSRCLRRRRRRFGNLRLRRRDRRILVRIDFEDRQQRRRRSRSRPRRRCHSRTNFPSRSASS
ncbi:hypothetical protein NDU88_005069 [Pleurodeles waltl]|uniref:Uncharacterized protein n=1 Tax=Pleurodeles waltl TaxID=8319 RepID=A0AAV7SKS7_PLEWA|nr:hypothetical protein NDU88_005069 [Pleurodeles waltl]